MEFQPIIDNLNNGLSERTKNELGKENLNNVNVLAQTIKSVSFEEGFDSHLLLVGGMVKTEKQGKYHKDVDMVLYCPSLATEYYTNGTHEDFDKFSGFLKKVNKKLNWNLEVENPWFFDYETGGDGKVIFSTENGTPIEVLPVRNDCLRGSFQDYLKSQKDPFEILF